MVRVYAATGPGPRVLTTQHVSSQVQQPPPGEGRGRNAATGTGTHGLERPPGHFYAIGHRATAAGPERPATKHRPVGDEDGLLWATIRDEGGPGIGKRDADDVGASRGGVAA